MFKEFKAFAMRGNVLDLAIGVIIGASFGKVVTSLVQDIIMPPLGLILGKMDFSNLFVSLSGTPFENLKEAQDAGAATLNYGLFINAIVNFLIVSFAIFLLVKQVNKLKKKEEVLVATKACPYCLSQVPLKASKCAYCTSSLT